jgi:hypothetical protein
VQSKVRTGTRSSLFLGLLLFSQAALAGVESTAREYSEKVGSEVQDLAEKLDLMLAGKKYSQENNKTRVNLSQLVSLTEGGKFVQSTDVGINLRLPNTEKRWQARFATYDEEQENRDMQQRRVRTTPRARDPGASVFFFQRLGDFRTSFQPKLQLKNPLEMSYIFKIASETDAKPVKIAPELQLFADAQNGTGEYFSTAFSGQVLERTQLTFDNEEEYHERDHSFSTRHGISMDHSLNESQAVGWAVIASSINHPQFHLDTLNLSTSFAHEYYKDLLKYVVSPFLGFAKADNFKGKAGISFTLTFIF